MELDQLVIEFNKLIERQIATSTDIATFVSKLISEYIKLADKDMKLALLVAKRQSALVEHLASTDTFQEQLADADISIRRATLDKFITENPNAEYFKINLTDGISSNNLIADSSEPEYIKPGILYGRSTGTGGDGTTPPIIPRR